MNKYFQNMKQWLTERWALLLILFVGFQTTALADTTLSIEDFSISYGETKEVAVLLDNDAQATALQAEIALPTGLTYVDGSVAKTDRVKGRGAEVLASTYTGKLKIVLTDCTIAAGEGTIITFKVASTLTPGNYEVNISDIVVSDANADQLNSSETASFTVLVSGLDGCKFAAAEESVEVNVGKEYQIDITLDNENVTNISALQGKLTLPKGLEIVEGEDGLFIYSDRIPGKAEFKFQKYDDYTTFVLSSTQNYTISGTSGTIFSFMVKATDALAEDTEIVLSDLRVAATTGVSTTESQTVTIAVKNMTLADKAAFEEYKAEQIAAVDALAQEGDSDAAKQIIAKAKADIEALEYDEEKTLEENKAAVDAVVEPVEEALAAQRAADQLAADKATFAEYQAEQAAAVEALKEEDDSDEALAIISAAVEDINALTYDESKTLAENKAAVDAFVTPVAEALATQRKADAAAAQLAADKAAFETYKSDQIAIVGALAEEGDSDASLAIIAKAVDEIEALEYDEEKSLEDNKAAVDALVEPVAAALAKQRESEAVTLVGDMDGDGEIDEDDVDAFIDKLFDELMDIDPEDPDNEEYLEKYDFNGDGKFDIADAQALLNISLGLNADGSEPEE